MLALNLAAAAASADVIVNTVIYVKGEFGLGDAAVAWALGATGAGSMAVALSLPRVIRRTGDRGPMLTGGGVLAAGLGLASAVGSLPRA